MKTIINYIVFLMLATIANSQYAFASDKLAIGVVKVLQDHFREIHQNYEGDDFPDVLVRPNSEVMFESFCLDGYESIIVTGTTMPKFYETLCKRARVDWKRIDLRDNESKTLGYAYVHKGRFDSISDLEDYSKFIEQFKPEAVSGGNSLKDDLLLKAKEEALNTCSGNIVISTRFDCVCAVNEYEKNFKAGKTDQTDSGLFMLDLSRGRLGCVNEVGLSKDTTDWCLGHLRTFESSMPELEQNQICDCLAERTVSEFKKNPASAKISNIQVKGMQICRRG